MNRELNVYVPKPGSHLERMVMPGSAIVGEATTERILVHFEGDKFGSMGGDYRKMMLHAADRHIAGYPTIARATVDADEVLMVGYYDLLTERLDIDEGEALESWIATSNGRIKLT